MQNDKNFRPDRIGAYFRIEWLPLVLVTVSGLIYNIGLLATPWFEGRLAQCLADILDGSATAAAIMGEMNIAIKTGTWLARVKEAGSIMILMGENIGITMPMAISMPASAS